MADECLICAKHRGEGPLVGPLAWEDDQVLVFHRPAGDDGTAVLGHLFVETRRHTPWLDTLTESEAGAVAGAVLRAARGLRAELRAEYVFSAVIGRGVAHFHQHVIAQHPGTPAELPWLDVHSWSDAPRGGPPDIADLCARLRPYLDGADQTAW